MPKKRLGELLLDAHLVSDADLARALEVQKTTGEKLGTTLLRLRMVDATMLVRALSDQLAVAGIDPGGATPSAEAMALIPENIAFELGCLPLRLEDGKLVVALADPTDSAALARLEAIGGRPVAAYVAPQMALFRALKRHYGGAISSGRAEAIRSHLADVRRILGEVERLLEPE